MFPESLTTGPELENSLGLTCVKTRIYEINVDKRWHQARTVETTGGKIGDTLAGALQCT